MNAYVTVDGVKMTRLSPEGGCRSAAGVGCGKNLLAVLLCGRTRPGTKMRSRQIFLASLAPY